MLICKDAAKSLRLEAWTTEMPWLRVLEQEGCGHGVSRPSHCGLWWGVLQGLSPCFWGATGHRAPSSWRRVPPAPRAWIWLQKALCLKVQAEDNIQGTGACHWKLGLTFTFDLRRTVSPGRGTVTPGL